MRGVESPDEDCRGSRAPSLCGGSNAVPSTMPRRLFDGAIIRIKIPEDIPNPN
jgi:hypothetical protein